MDAAATRLILNELAHSFKEPGTKAVLQDAVPFAAAGFYEISPAAGKVTFVDGGNAPIVSTPGFALHKCRFAAVTYDGVRKTGRKIDECFILAARIGDKLRVSIIRDAVQESFAFSVADKSLMDGLQEATPDRAAVVARQLLELDFAAKQCAAGMVVLDRDLQTMVPGEGERLQALFRAGRLDVACLSKTTRLVTETGFPVSAALGRMAPHASWLYHALNTGTPGIGVVKLHAKSKRCFRLDVVGDALRVANALATHARDPSFLGYPYGLVDADANARVSNAEAGQLRAILLSRSKDGLLEDWADILTSHAVLDSMR